jgi:hypothetical protein
MAQVYCFQSCSCFRVHAHEPVGQRSKRLEQRVEPGFAFGVEHLHEIKPHRFGDEREGRDVKGRISAAENAFRADAVNQN